MRKYILYQNVKSGQRKLNVGELAGSDTYVRLPDGAPAKSALFESLKPCDRPQGRPKNM